ncbi:pentatricopeptide repeat-containing protein, partial [Trifolium pratense]
RVFTVYQHGLDYKRDVWKVDCPEACPVCELETEHDWHFLFACNDSICAWTAAGLDVVILPRLQMFHTVKEVILDVCSEDRDVAGKMAFLVWSLWKNRNNCVWNNTKETGQQIGIKTVCMWRDWQVVQTVSIAGPVRE